MAFSTSNASGFDTPRKVASRISRSPGSASGAMVTSTIVKVEIAAQASVGTNSRVRFSILAINAKAVPSLPDSPEVLTFVARFNSRSCSFNNCIS